MADENPQELGPVEQANVKEAKDRMANFSPAMLLHMRQWCEMKAKEKRLLPSDFMFYESQIEPQTKELTFDGLKAGEPRLADGR
jgi:hypothetical protein